MRSGRASYIQIVIGDCGHLCDGWPLVNGQVICDECTAERFNLDQVELEGLAHWVSRKPPEKSDTKALEQALKPPPRKRTPKRKAGTPLRQDGLW